MFPDPDLLPADRPTPHRSPPRGRPAAARPADRSLAWRTLVQIKHNPFELLDFSIQPVMFLLLFIYVFGGAISGSPDDYLQFRLAGIMRAEPAVHHPEHRRRAQHRPRKGFFSRLRSLPIARLPPLAGRIVADLAKQAWALALLFAVASILGFRAGTGPLAVLARIGLLLVLTLAFAWSRSGSRCWSAPGEGPALRLRPVLPAHLHQRRVREDGDACPAGCRPGSRSTRSRSWPTRPAAC